MKRFIEFDVLRGILLLMMSVDHSPSSLRRFTDQPLGFFSTGEPELFGAFAKKHTGKKC